METETRKTEEVHKEQQSAPVKNPFLPKRRQRSGSVMILLSFFFGIFGGILGWWVGPKLADDLGIHLPSSLEKNTSNEAEKKNSTFVNGSSDEASIINLVEKNTPAVVSIVISKDMPKYRNFFDSPGFPFFFGDPSGESRQNFNEMERQKIGEGSGFFVSSDGTIVTNRHVVDDPKAEYTILTSDKKEYPAHILALDPTQDIAIMKVDAVDISFPALELGDSDSIRVGQTVIAIGNSLGEFSNTVSKGIVSGLRRNLIAGSGFGSSERLSGIIQTDAAINPGNSGGPLLDLSGKVIGVNVAMAQGAENISFSIPVNIVKNSITSVKETGKISAPYIGVRYALITPEVQKENNLPFEYGVLIVRGEKLTDLAVIPGSPADKAGIIENDILLEIDGTKMNSENDLASVIGTKRVGDVVTIKIWHKGETKDIKVTLEERR